MHTNFHVKRISIDNHNPRNANEVTLRIHEHDGMSTVALFNLTDEQVAHLKAAFGAPESEPDAVRQWLHPDRVWA